MRTEQQVLDEIAVKSQRIEELFTSADARDDKANSKEELAEITKLTAEIEPLEAERTEIKRVTDIKENNSRRIADLKTVTPPVPHPNGQPGSVIEFPYASNLKHITGATREAAMTKAYRFGQWFLAGVLNRTKSVEWCKAHGLEVKAAQESDNALGGAIVPPEFDNMIIDLKERFGVFRPNTKVVPMASDTKTVPRRTGGLTAYFVGEGQTITASDKTWDNVMLVAKKMAALAVFSSEIQEDAIINLADDLAFEMGYAFANKEDDCGFNGDGTSGYGAITGVAPKLKGLSGTIADIAGLVVAAGNAYSEIVLSDFNKVVGRLPQYADTPNAKWFMHKTFYHEVAEKLALAAGGVTAAEVAAGARTFRFLGYSVQFAQVLPKVEGNSQVCALLGDLALASKMGDRRQTTVFLDPYSKSATDQLQIRGTQRIDIVVHDVGNANATAALRQAGPVVGLITAAS